MVLSSTGPNQKRYFGQRCGDVNGDGLDDIIIGAFQAEPDANDDNGRGVSYVVFGKTAGAIIELPCLVAIKVLS